jgi:mono/diheme cytochrome c family protein
MSKRAGFVSFAGGLTLISAIFAGGGSCDAQQVGNAGQGRRVAHADCAQCRGVDRDSYSNNLEAPTFDDIANVPGMTSRALIVAL